MQLLVNDMPVAVNPLPFKDYAGFILQLLIKDGPERSKLHQQLNEALRSRFSFTGVMDNKRVKKGFSEVRLLNKTSLEVIDHLRSVGFGIVEAPPF